MPSGCSVRFSLLSSAMLWEFSAVSPSIHTDCSGSASCPSALLQMLFPLLRCWFSSLLSPQNLLVPGACVPHAPPWPSLGTCCMCCGCITSLQHHPCPARRILSSPSISIFINFYRDTALAGQEKATSPALSLIELLFSMIEDYTEFSSFKYANLC